MELQNWVGSLHDKMMVSKVADATEGRLMELDVSNAGMTQETVDNFKDVDRTLCQVLIACTQGEAKNYACNPERSEFKAWQQVLSHFDPRTGANRSDAYSRVTHQWATVD